VLAVALVGLAFDVVLNFNRVHRGVTVQGVAVGGMTREEAAVLLKDALGALIGSEPVVLFADEQAAHEGAGPRTLDLTAAPAPAGGAPAPAEGDTPAPPHSWQIGPLTVGATTDADALVQAAYGIGRGADVLGRLQAGILGVELPAFLDYGPSQLAYLEGLLDAALGWGAEDAGIEFVDGAFVVVGSTEGRRCDHAALVRALDRAFLGADRAFQVPLAVAPPAVTDEKASEVAAFAQEALARPVTLALEGEGAWELDASVLGPWTGASVEGAGAAVRLVPHIETERLEAGLPALIGGGDRGVPPQDARFEVVDGQVTVVPGVEGTGIDYAKAAGDLDALLFSPDGAEDGAQGARRVVLATTARPPARTTEQAVAMNITGVIASYTTEYTAASSAKATNIRLASELLDNSLIAPGGVWSFNDTAGECNAERGFQEAASIVEGSFVDEIGGGICQVATTVFNAAFDSGLPIVERTNHALYLVAYPAGRDAAVSWRWADLKFENDTENWILLTMDCTDTTVTCTLWGTDPGYRVEFTDTGFTDRTDFETKEVEAPELPKGERKVRQEGVRGRSIVVTRYVYDSAGELLRQSDFRSVYEPEPEVVEVGTKEEPPDKKAAAKKATDRAAADKEAADEKARTQGSDEGAAALQ
jgi:vancomycin resistance protein YoaR